VTYSPRDLAANGVPESRTRLRAYRRSIRRTAKDVAAIAGVSAQTVLVFERGGNVEDERAIVAAYADLVPAPDYAALCRQFRERTGMSQRTAAGLIGADKRTWSQLERRGHSVAPTDEMRAKLDAVLAQKS
jgi:DNA-binding XRE family transcriptional regulator